MQSKEIKTLGENANIFLANANKCTTVNELITLANKYNIVISLSAVKSILKSLAQRSGKLTDDALDSVTGGSIFEILDCNPGIYKADVCQKCINYRDNSLSNVNSNGVVLQIERYCNIYGLVKIIDV